MALSFRVIRNMGMTLMLLLIVALGLIPSLLMQRISPSNQQMVQHLAILQKTIVINDSFRRAKWHFDAFVRKEETDVAPVLVLTDQAMAAARELMGGLPEREQGSLGDFLKVAGRFKTAVLSYVEEAEYDPIGSTAVEMEDMAFKISQAAHEAIQSLMKNIREDIQAARIHMAGTVKRGQRISLLGLLVGLIAGLIVPLLIGRTMERPIRNLVEATQKIAQGDLTYRVKVDSHDVIGQLADSFNKMARQLAFNEQRVKATNQQLVANEEKLRITNRQLAANEQQLKAANQQLAASEQQLKASEAALKNRVRDLERFKKVTVGREMRMITIKREVNELLRELGREEKYDGV